MSKGQFPTTVMVFPGVLRICRDQEDLDETLRSELEFQGFVCKMIAAGLAAFVGFLVYMLVQICRTG